MLTFLNLFLHEHFGFVHSSRVHGGGNHSDSTTQGLGFGSGTADTSSHQK